MTQSARTSERNSTRISERTALHRSSPLTTKPFLPSNGSSLRRGPGLLFIYVDVTCYGDSEPRYIAVRRQEGRKG